MVGTNIDISVFTNSNEGSERSEEQKSESYYYFREYIYYEQNVGKKYVKGASGEISEGNEEYVTGN